MMLLKGFTLPGSTFYKKQQENKLNMCKIHYQRELTSKWMKIQQHVYDTSANVNLCFCFLIDLPSIQTTKCVEVSKLKEIDVDVFLTSIPKPEMTWPQCPCCLVDMTFGCILNEDGSQWDYYGFPMTHFGTKYYVACAKEDLVNYLKAALYVNIAQKNLSVAVTCPWC